HAILAYLYSGLSSACLGKPFYGCVILLDIWLHLHIKMDFSKDETDNRIRTYDRCPIFRVRDALHYTNSMIIKTLRVRVGSEWREFLEDLPRVKFVFSSEALDNLRLKVRPGPGVELRLVDGKELVLYNPHRCFLQLGQPRHMIPTLSHYAPIESRMLGTYQ